MHADSPAVSDAVTCTHPSGGYNFREIVYERKVRILGPHATTAALPSGWGIRR
ncbi:hypothetical protein EYZ11_012618 [Aspergillus tanneri]|uniref:Uncharacterized protein n=1 Tax=Aspergillus tanneri TaxID=1220188 RepID=A0A4S3J014_9EURO|nr:hypothetical protein EYZ11_012618 [Aspergillus tanneri]